MTTTHQHETQVITTSNRRIIFGPAVTSKYEYYYDPYTQYGKDLQQQQQGGRNKNNNNNKMVTNDSNTTVEAIFRQQNNDYDYSDDNDETKSSDKKEFVIVGTNENITAASDLSDVNRNICIVTTAALPWRTGTAVNPMLRALYLTHNRPKHAITLVIPWLPSASQQAKLFGTTNIFETQKDQETWIRNYCKDTLNCHDEIDNLKILFYSSTYHEPFGSIFATQDICQLIPKDTADIAILEEPEHLNWFRVPPKFDDKNVTDEEKRNAELGWTKKFNHVVGILHTNYSAYMKQYGMGTHIIAASVVSALSTIAIRAYCHRVIRLSDTLPALQAKKEVTCNVHGVQSRFLERYETKNNQESLSSLDNDKSCYYAPIYFIGKLIWAKGFDELLEIQELYKDKTGEYFPIDVYGSGSDSKEIQRAFLGRRTTSSKSPSASTATPSSSSSSSPSSSPKSCDNCTNHEEKSEFLFRKSKSLSGQLDAYLADNEDDYDTTVTPPQDDNDDDDDDNVNDDNDDDEVEEEIIIKELSKEEEKREQTSLASRLMLPFPTKRRSSDNNKKPSLSPLTSLLSDPPKSRFELRRNPLPARFMGVKDHGELRFLPNEHKIFLNMSTTEVLCTTTAEALAMGKFVIIPRHPSNRFFYQFPNCLSYKNRKECVQKIQYALTHEPQELSEKERYAFSWEGANERLYKAASVLLESQTNTAKADLDVAKFHIESIKKGRLVHQYFSPDLSNLANEE